MQFSTAQGPHQKSAPAGWRCRPTALARHPFPQPTAAAARLGAVLCATALAPRDTARRPPHRVTHSLRFRYHSASPCRWPRQVRQPRLRYRRARPADGDGLRQQLALDKFASCHCDVTSWFKIGACKRELGRSTLLRRSRLTSERRTSCWCAQPRWGRAKVSACPATWAAMLVLPAVVASL